MKYIKVKQLQRMLDKIDDPEAEIFFTIQLPKALEKLAPHLLVDLHKPRFHDHYTDVDGSTNVWCTFKVKVEAG
jgi:hypothetical protein